MKKCGLLGRRLSHSYSPAIHGLFGRTEYALFEKEPQELEEFLSHGDFDGLNVTIPYKKEVMRFLDEISPEAAAIGSVNTILRQKDGSLCGFNTDETGFEAMLSSLKADVGGKKCLVLGSGGAGVMAKYVLEKHGGRVTLISRSGKDNYENLKKHYDAKFIVNTTPVGMYPNAGEAPLSLTPFKECEGVLDVIYNPAETKLLQEAESLKIPSCGGLLMLIEQARQASQIWTGEKISDEESKKVLLKIKADTVNIVIVGMPGCGKSAVGRALRDMTGRELIDSDAVIAEETGMPIPEFFEKFGEEAFRKEETKVLKKICQRSSLIISTGGGCVTREENYPLLRQNGAVIWLWRDISLLSKKGRPLSLGTDLSAMYEKREPLYERFSDARVDSTGVVELTAQKMLEVYDEIIGDKRS